MVTVYLISSVGAAAGFNTAFNVDQELKATLPPRVNPATVPAHKLGRLWKFLASEVDQWVKCGSASDSGARKPDVPRTATDL